LQRLSIGGGLIGLPDTGPFEQGEITLNQGDRLFLFLDGLIDHTDAAGECFGEQRLIQNLTRNDSTLQQSCLAGIDAMHNFREEMPSQDDVSLLGVEFTKSTALEQTVTL
jgi:sigma-B regulation protein RsbU (phosphoserine phosphatase)